LILQPPPFGTPLPLLWSHSVLHGLEHLVGLKVLPVEYVPFIGFQVFYTFVLGLICGQSLLRFHSVLAPMALHFIFNLTFYFALQLEII
jgi:membrane protease YdiL (CAAX protease family)